MCPHCSPRPRPPASAAPVGSALASPSPRLREIELEIVAPNGRLSPRARGREAMTYGRVHTAARKHTLGGAAVSHSAELVGGYFLSRGREGPLIRPSCRRRVFD